MAVKSRPETSIKPIVAADDAEGGGCVLQKPTRRKMDVMLNSVGLQLAVVITVFMQIPLLGTLLLIDLRVIRDPPRAMMDELSLLRLSQNGTTRVLEDPGGDSPVELTERILHTINIVILLLFLVEIILRVSARGSRIHTDGQQVCDCGVVMLTFVLYVAFTAASMRTAAYGTGLFILLRLWRIQRIYKTIAEQERRKLEKTLATHRKAQKDTEEQLKQTTSKLTAMQQEMDVLQQQLKVIHYIGKASPAVSSSAYSKVSEDLVTSDEESERYTDCDSQIQTPKTLDTIQAEIAGRRFYHTSSIHTSNSPSPATSFSHLVDEFLMNSEFKDFKDLSSLSKVAPTKVSVPDLVEHLQAADVISRGVGSNDDGVYNYKSEEADVTKDSMLYAQHHPPQIQTQQTQHRDSGPPSPPPPPPAPCESQDGVGLPGGLSPEAGSSSELSSKSRQLGDGESNSGVVLSASERIPTTTAYGPSVAVTQREDKLHLIRDTTAVVKPETNHKAEKGHDNLAFEGEGSSLREQDALKKSSAVPFNKHYGSSTYLNEEGIPMTDL